MGERSTEIEDLPFAPEPTRFSFLEEKKKKKKKRNTIKDEETFDGVKTVAFTPAEWFMGRK
jgi:hypothetical protein